MLNSAEFLQRHELSSGKLGSVGFCWGGGATNYLAVQMGDALGAAVPFYGAAPDGEDVKKISAPLMIQSAENDPRINAMWPDFESALKANNKSYVRHLYPGTRHGFHNNSTPRYDEAAAKLAWERTVTFFQENLA